ncbi:alcohol dehydrogenase catalytic domain-containing protein [Enterococcus cecorum]|uniref:alcohol dehydrogenase catalytic domain-containing protein n=1 Tax=Enterococcus cecorum TaxID=44008 RepID=UPI000A745ABA|nr:alcohol dehydrogenase catalytic domain-containing protein [Enterococcus cecorum]MCJ0552921.1 alcohol dehydrogenase catalytic domain-containing protein [Enterococcus cecorum]MCJ0557316.1 alcohol dehydrogenase catalytic domain-containing protein [Enterococcus cecorum]MCJ0561577.1 alcohol dehydrogenase catalytic domain-containing protein [Enterococcus cecorum]MCJ0566778.1 alcohol dehydrogenase catalytic domain-containing protein [Enterococcus cecorum]MCJ0594196.1 alcohol dehydrogenase catalyti
MKAAYIQKYGQAKITLGNLDKPRVVNSNQVLVKVSFISINPVDLKIQQGKLKPLLHFVFPLILGNDYVGIVEQVGSQVRSIKVVQRVSGRISKNQIGTFANT